MFIRKSENALENTVLDPEFLVDIEFQRENYSIDDYILNSPQSITVTYIPEPSESSRAAFPPNSSASPSVKSRLSSPPTTPPSNPENPLVNPPKVMATRYAPLVLPQVLNDMSTDYQSKITIFDATQGITAQQHVDKMNDFFVLHEVEEENVATRLFVQSFGGEVRKWFRALPAGSIHTLQDFHTQFLDWWEVKRNPHQTLSEYENIKRNVGETVKDYCFRFNAVYNAILANLKPPVDLAMLKFPDGFDADMAYQLRERDPPSLEEMKKIAVSVEANLLARRARAKAEKKVVVKEEASPSDSKMDTLIHTMERMVERLTISDKPETQIRNLNFRG